MKRSQKWIVRCEASGFWGKTAHLISDCKHQAIVNFKKAMYEFETHPLDFERVPTLYKRVEFEDILKEPDEKTVE